MRLAIPSYFYPGALWAQAETHAETEVLIINPNSGPGLQADPNYAKVVADCRAKGINILGYVHTTYGNRKIDDVLREVTSYQAFYPALSGIFLDETPGTHASASAVSFYKQVTAHIRAAFPNAYVAMNPGTNTDEVFSSLADALMIFEGNLPSFRAWQPSPWVRRHPPARFWVVVYSVDAEADMRACVSGARAAGVGLVYVTDAGLPNPWASLPPYFAALAGAVRSE